MLCVNLLMIGSLAQPAPSPDPKPIPVSGSVLDAAGKPVGGADLWLTRAARPEDDPRSGMELFWAGRASTDDQEDAAAFAQARFNAEGRFRLEVPTEIAARPAPVSLVVWTVSPGSRICSRRLPRVLQPDDPPIRLALGPATQSELTILGPDGQAIAGAKVVPSRIEEMPVLDAMPASTSPSFSPGTARIAGNAFTSFSCTSGRRINATYRSVSQSHKQPAAHSSSGVRHHDPGDSAPLRDRPGELAPSPDPRPLPMSGMVVDSTGKPVAGAEVWLADGIAPRDHRLFGDEMYLEPLARTGPRSGAGARARQDGPGGEILRRSSGQLHGAALA